MEKKIITHANVDYIVDLDDFMLKAVNDPTVAFRLIPNLRNLSTESLLIVLAALSENIEEMERNGIVWDFKVDMSMINWN